MRRVMDCFLVSGITVLVLDSPPPLDWKCSVCIRGTNYETEMVFDIPNAIGIIGNGDFQGEIVEFL